MRPWRLAALILMVGITTVSFGFALQNGVVPTWLVFILAFVTGWILGVLARDWVCGGKP